MVKLDELRKDDIIYYVYEYHWIEKVKIVKEKKPFEYQDLNEPTIYYVEGKIISDQSWNNGTKEQFFEKDENTIFKTIEEAKEYQLTQRNKQVEFLKTDNNLLDSLFKKAIYNFNDTEREIYDGLIKIATINFKE